VNAVYYAPNAHTGSTLALAAVFYSFQIYCDFSGYADMAIGSGRVMGFKIMQNLICLIVSIRSKSFGIAGIFR